MSLFWLVLLPILIAILSYIIGATKSKYFILVFQAFFFIMAFINFNTIKHQGAIVENLGDFPQGIGITLYCDNIASVLILLNIFLFSGMILFSIHKEYMNKLFLLLFLILQGLLNGIFLSNDLFNLYVLIDLATIVVSILIMFKKDSRSIYDGMIYLLVNIVAMLFFLLGVGYIYKIFGVLDMTLIHERMAQVTDANVLILPYCFLMTAVGLKAAIMPLFSWLPRAHGTPSAPSVVSAILSGLYVKGGLYLFIRIQDMFQPYLDTQNLFLILGFFTAIVGFIIALSQTDIKLILAYHTVSQIGLIIFGLSIGNIDSYWGSIYHILNHAIFKSVLFLTAGIIIEVYQTRDIRQIHGVFQRMPFVATVTIIAILGITGAPLFNGSISKYLIHRGTTSILEYGLIIINLGTVISFVKYSSMFKGQIGEAVHKIPLNQKIVTFFLASICFSGGIFGSRMIQYLFNITVTVSFSGYVQKSVVYILSLVVGYLFYKYIYRHIPLFKKIRDIELSFPSICLSIVVFFSGLLVFMLITA